MMGEHKEIPQRTILIRVVKPFFYYAQHKSGEVFHIEMKDLSLLLKTDYVEVVLNDNGYNTEAKDYPYETEERVDFP